MVLERFRNFAMRTRRSNVVPLALPTTGSRGNLFEDIANGNPVQVPPSPIESIIQDVQGSAGASCPVHTRDMATQTEPFPDPQTDQTMTKDETKEIKEQVAEQAAKKPAKKAAKKAADTDRRRELESQLLAMAKVATTNGGAIVSSGLAVSKYLNETAREILEADTIISRLDGETARLKNQMEMMELRFNSAYVQFSRARAIHHTMLDYSYVETHKETVLVELTKWMELIKQTLQDEAVEVSEWPMAKVHDILSKLDQLHKQNKNHYNFDAINKDICSVMNQFRKIDFDAYYHPLLIVGLDPVDFVQKLRKEDLGLAKARAALPPAITSCIPEPKTVAMKYRKGRLFEPQLQLLGRVSLSNEPFYLSPGTGFHNSLVQTSSGLADCGCSNCNLTQTAAQQKGIACSHKPVSYIPNTVVEENFSLFREVCSLGMGAMGTMPGEEYAMQVLDPIFDDAQKGAEGSSKASFEPTDATKSFGCALENFEKICAAHIETCEICKQSQADFVAKECIML